MSPQSVIILTSDKSKQGIESDVRFQYVQDFCDGVEAKLKNVRVHFALYDDIHISVRSNHVEMYDTRNKLDLKEVSFVHFKNWVNDAETASAIANYLDHHGKSFYNSEVQSPASRTKIAQMVTLALGGVSVPDTFFASNNQLSQLFESETLPEGFALPLIVKANDGAKGNDNYLVRSFDDAKRIIKESDENKEYVVQAYHENDGDYRFLYIGLDAKPMVFHRQSTSDSHLNNTSQGGVGTLVEADKVPNEYYALAYDAAAILKREIGGVDILVNKNTSIPYVLEVNATPALATGYGVEEKVRRFAQFIEDYIDMEEEE